jgi:GDP-4-dehydro-6-deoxy-D-mannose reductase
MVNMKKYLITGCSGFVARHFIELLINKAIHAEIIGLDIVEPVLKMPESEYVKFKFIRMDLQDIKSLSSLIENFPPDYLLHLASLSSVAMSWEKPAFSFMNNTNIYLNLLESIKKLKKPLRLLSVGSSEEYGILSKENLPVTEDCVLNPNSPYAVARVSQEMMSKLYVKALGCDIVMTRSFNHFGPGQRPSFAVPSFITQIIEARGKSTRCHLRAGNINVIRDYVDVRDVVKAYYLLFEKGISGEVYNVCSGEGISLREIITKVSRYLNVKTEISIDNSLLRPGDNPVIIGSPSKIISGVGWRPEINIDQSLGDSIKYYETEILSAKEKVN